MVAAQRQGPRPSINAPCVNFDADVVRDKLMARIDKLRGEYRVSIEPTRQTRSQRANAKYWVAWVKPFAVYMLEQGSARTMDEAQAMAHEEIVRACLGVDTWTSPVTGEVRERPKPTHGLPFDEFSAFMQRSECWLAEMGVFVDQDWTGAAVGGGRQRR